MAINQNLIELWIDFCEIMDNSTISLKLILLSFTEKITVLKFW